MPATTLDAIAPARLASRTAVMGILNVTPDSFSDGGEHASVEGAVSHALQMVHDGADIIDVGGESTRPGHAAISVDEELRRVIPVLEALVPQCTVPISIDTTKSEVARRAMQYGARIINDQWGLQGDGAMARTAAETGAALVVMHNQRGHQYADLMGDVIAFLRRSVEIAREAGVPEDRVFVDPGFGFGKTPAQNLEVLRRVGEIRGLGCPILVGTSRKSTIGHVLGSTSPKDRADGTAATVALAIAFGADIVRVHDVAAMTRVVRMTDAVVKPRFKTED